MAVVLTILVMAVTLGAATAQRAVRVEPGTPAALAPAGGLHVQGPDMVDAAGQAVQLGGVGRSGTEYACLAGKAVFVGPIDQASTDAMLSWHVDAVRVPLNEDCWLGINHVAPRTSGAAYRDAIAAYVAQLTHVGMVVILDLHWSAPGDALATSQQDMADADHSVTFWRQVARAYSTNNQVLFELYNEPHDISWKCWLNGCEIPATAHAQAFEAAGMQQLIDAVRGVGAANPVVLDGPSWATDLRQWRAFQPTDPRRAVIAGWHLYGPSSCSENCWRRTVDALRGVPVLVTEIGEIDCGGGYMRQVLPWLDQHGIGYLIWAWNTWKGCAGPSLLSADPGVPHGRYGLTVQRHLRYRFPLGTASS